MTSVIPILAKKEFISNDTAKHFNVLYPFNTNEQDQIEAFVKELNDAISKVNYFELSTSVDVYEGR